MISLFLFHFSLFPLSPAESEFENYRIVQDRLFESDFDEMIKKLPVKGDTP